ncbi:MAG: pseudouridine synthase [Deferribacteraceae bacterium]|nr:pseudouridine synthase [Deferribacteraceae bacterium]
MTEKLIRLAKRIALTGDYSRRGADILVSDGRVTVNGETALIGAKVTADGNEVILVDGKPLGRSDKSVYIFYKPRGILSSYRDPHNKKDLSLFPELARRKLGYSGRLDRDSEGLMLFTGDGGLIYRIQRKEFRVEKEYDVTTDKELGKAWLNRLKNGWKLGECALLPCRIEQSGAKRYSVTLVEGKKRQIRRMFKAAGANVERLIRVRVGGITISGLKEGELRKLSEEEVKTLLDREQPPFTEGNFSPLR